jgi:midasin (ATPase involved in ribosome maturation)
VGGCYTFHIIESQAQPFGFVDIAVGYPVKLFEDMIDMLMRYTHSVICNAYLKFIIISDRRYKDYRILVTILYRIGKEVIYHRGEIDNVNGDGYTFCLVIFFEHSAAIA